MLLIFSAIFHILHFFQLPNIALSSISFAVFSKLRVFAVSSRRMMMLACIFSQRSAPWFTISFPSPGKMISRIPKPVYFNTKRHCFSLTAKNIRAMLSFFSNSSSAKTAMYSQRQLKCNVSCFSYSLFCSTAFSMSTTLYCAWLLMRNAALSLVGSPGH